MASTPTPTPNYSSVPPPRASENHNSHRNHTHRNRHHQRQNKKRWSSSSSYSNSIHAPLTAIATEKDAVGNGSAASAAAAAASGAAATNGSAPVSLAPPAAGSGSGSGSGRGRGTAGRAFSSSLGSLLGDRKTRLAPEFSGRRTTRFAAKMHSGQPRFTPNKHPHTKAAEEALHCLFKAGNNRIAIDNVLLTYQHKLWGCDDYIYMLKEFANTGHLLQANRCFEFSMCREHRKDSKGKLTSAMIGTLGRLGMIEDAISLFEDARCKGYGITVYSFSAMITAYGRNGFFADAVNLFRSMHSWGLEPNLITYNALIDAGAKSEVDFKTVVNFFDEMVDVGFVPDRLTYNSLLAVCAPKGMWEVAQDLSREMDQKGIDRDLYTYNTYLDTLCKGGQMDIAKIVLEEMPSRRIWPNVVTFSTMMDGYAKANRLEDALNLYDEMKRRSIGVDRVSYNTLVGVYGKLGWFDEALATCKEMERGGIRTDVVTYNALMGGYGKHGMYDEVRNMFEEMKARNVYPNTLTYSTMIDMYTKGGMFREAMDVYREFRQAGLEVDVVFYSALIDALCKNGLVESSMMLIDVMIEKGIKPNVVTFNSIIDAFGQFSAIESGAGTSSLASGYPVQHSSPMLIDGAFQNQVTDNGDDRIMKMFEQLAYEKAGHIKMDKRSRQDQLWILWLFRRMHEMKIKPNVVTFSAILNACSRCNSFEDASKLLGELRLFDNQVYGVAHGLLMGYREQVWFQAHSLFDELKRMDSSTASAFYNALTDMLWHFGQRRGAQEVVMAGRTRNVWQREWTHSSLDLHLMSCGAACAMVHEWLLGIRAAVFEGYELPKIINILTGWGKHSKVMGDGTLKKAVEALLDGMGSPFWIAECNLGRFVSRGYMLANWLRQSSTVNMLLLHDVRNHSEAGGSSHDVPALGC